MDGHIEEDDDPVAYTITQTTLRYDDQPVYMWRLWFRAGGTHEEPPTTPGYVEWNGDFWHHALNEGEWQGWMPTPESAETAARMARWAFLTICEQMYEEEIWGEAWDFRPPELPEGYIRKDFPDEDPPVI